MAPAPQQCWPPHRLGQRGPCSPVGQQCPAKCDAASMPLGEKSAWVGAVFGRFGGEGFYWED
eukprot:10222351-Prorocentrum_lima.AAC.1